jgi:hypothetical protein
MTKLVMVVAIGVVLAVAFWVGEQRNQSVKACRDAVWATHDNVAERGLTYQEAATLGKQTTSKLNECEGQ